MVLCSRRKSRRQGAACHSKYCCCGRLVQINAMCFRRLTGTLRGTSTINMDFPIPSSSGLHRASGRRSPASPRRAEYPEDAHTDFSPLHYTTYSRIMLISAHWAAVSPIEQSRERPCYVFGTALVRRGYGGDLRVIYLQTNGWCCVFLPPAALSRRGGETTIF